LYFTDVLMVLAAIITVGLMVSWYPARRAAMMAETGLKAN
jgi:ABC-type lipoprotein release transport system permease subunit